MNKSRSILTVALALSLLAGLPLLVRADTIVVTSAADSGPGSLRQAVADAKPGDTIEFAPLMARIELTGGEIVIGKDLEIDGPVAQSPQAQLVLDAKGLSRLFHVTRPPGGVMPVVVLSDLALTGGAAQGGNGGAVLNEGALTLLRCSVHGNAALPGNGGGGNGGGIANTGSLDVQASAIYGNRAVVSAASTNNGNGGGIYSGWGGVDAVAPDVLLLDSTLSGNEAGAQAGRASSKWDAPSHALAVEARIGLGGGLYNDCLPAGPQWGVDAFPGAVEAESSTIADNQAWTGGGLSNLPFSENGSSVIGEVAGGAVLLRGCILSGNAASASGGVPDLLGDALPFDTLLKTHLGNIGGHDNILGQDAGLKPLAANGGPTMTQALQVWSPAVNAGAAILGLSTDQTGATRVVAGRADCGAWEDPAPPMPLGKGAAASYKDRDGDTVRIVLSGPGQGYTTVTDGADAVDIVLEGTTQASELQIETAGQTTVRNVQVTGGLKGFKAPDADLLGSLSVSEGARTVVLRDVTGLSEISLGAAPGQGSRIELRNVRDLVLRTPGKIDSLSAASWEGQGDGAHDILRAARIGKIDVAGWIRDVRIESEGDVDKVQAGGFEDSYVMAGVSPGLIGLADPKKDFVASAKIGEFKVTGAVSDAGGFQFIDGILSAASIGKASLGVVSSSQQSTVCGLSAGSIKRLEYTLGGRAYAFKNLETSSQSVRSGSFTASLDSTDDLGFTFGVLDDTRSDLALPGININNLGYLFQQAAQDHCRFLLMPGDFATGYMVMCSNASTCAAFDPNGTLSTALSDLQYQELIALAGQYGYTLGQNLYATRGNHECYLEGDATRSQWTKYVGQLLPQNGPTQGTAPDQNPQMDERGFSYSFRYGNSLFIGVDEYATINDKDNGLLPASSTVVPSVFCNGWLAEQIAAFKADGTLQHCFAFGHSPLYRVEMYTSMDATPATAAGRDAFVQAVSGSAEIYFCGHEHFYDHTIISGTTLPGGSGIDALHQVLVGTGGADIDAETQNDCHYSASYVLDPARQYYHNPEVPSSGKPQPYIGYNLVTVSGANVSFLWKAWHVNNPCTILPCGLCSTCTLDPTPMTQNSWNYSVQRSH